MCSIPSPGFVCVFLPSQLDHQKCSDLSVLCRWSAQLFRSFKNAKSGNSEKAYDLLQGSFFPECVARVRSTLRLRPQPSATVRNCSREVAMAVPMASSARVTLGGFTCPVASFRVAAVALRDIQTCFVTCRKWFCVAGAILLQRFQKMSGRLRGRRSTLDVSVFILRGRRSTRRVLWLVLCESHCQGCLKWWQGANSVAGVAFCEMCWKLMEALHETSILR